MTRPLSARSVIASTLLGTTPPRLPGRLLVPFAGLFDISEGTTRVALSRMVDRGELVNDDGTYALAGDLLARHGRQEEGLRPITEPWSGRWVLYVVDGPRRSRADRLALRRAFHHLTVFEQREGVWLRPDNLSRDRMPGQQAVVAGQTHRYLVEPDEDPALLAAQLFDLDAWMATAAALEARMEVAAEALDADGAGALAAGFEVAAAVLRHLLVDPLLPDSLWPGDRPSPRFRAEYEAYDRRYRDELAQYFALAGSNA